MLDVDERQVFAERKAAGKPGWPVPKRDSFTGIDQTKLADVARRCRVGQVPEV